MDSEEIQQEQQLPLGDGRPETSKSGAVAVSSPAVDPTSPLNVDLALALLERRDLPPETLEQQPCNDKQRERHRDLTHNQRAAEPLVHCWRCRVARLSYPLRKFPSGDLQGRSQPEHNARQQ